MPRRVGLPGASELFRSTAAHELARPRDDDRRTEDDRTPDAAGRPRRRGSDAAGAAYDHATPDAPGAAGGSHHARRGSGRPEQDRTPAASGRVKHDEKITIYVSSEELLALERLRLDLRAEHRVAVDRGRIVRAAIAEALADVAERGADSALLRRLAQS